MERLIKNNSHTFQIWKRRCQNIALIVLIWCQESYKHWICSLAANFDRELKHCINFNKPLFLNIPVPNDAHCMETKRVIHIFLSLRLSVQPVWHTTKSYTVDVLIFLLDWVRLLNKKMSRPHHPLLEAVQLIFDPL